MRSLIWALFAAATVMHNPAFGAEISTKRHYVKGDFAFYEPASIATPGVGFYLRKVQTRLVTKVDGTTTSGRPIKIWQIKAALIDGAEEGARIDAAVADAKSAFPEWRDFIFQARSITRKHCRLNLNSLDILVQSGATENPAEVSSDVCLLTIASRTEEAESAIENGIAQGTIIDYGVDPITFKQNVDLTVNVGRMHRVLTPLHNRLTAVEAPEAYFYAGYALAKTDSAGILANASINTAKTIIRDVTAALFTAQADGESYALVQAPANENIVVQAGKTDVFQP
jgi:hypothetical protein